MNNKKIQPSNQSIDDLFDEYSFELDELINSFAMKFGYFPKDPEGFEYAFCPPEVKEMSLQFFTDPYVQKLDTLATLFYDMREYFK